MIKHNGRPKDPADTPAPEGWTVRELRRGEWAVITPDGHGVGRRFTEAGAETLMRELAHAEAEQGRTRPGPEPGGAQ